ETEFLLEFLAPQAKRRASLRRDFRLEILDERSHRLRGFRLRICQIAKQVEVVDRGKSLGKIVVDELQCPAHRFDADFDKDPRWIGDIVASGLNQPRSLAELGEYPARAFVCRGVGKKRLRGETRPKDV